MSGSLLVNAALPLKIDSCPVVCSENVRVAYYSVLKITSIEHFHFYVH